MKVLLLIIHRVHKLGIDVTPSHGSFADEPPSIADSCIWNHAT